MNYQLDLFEKYNAASNLDELWQKLHDCLANFGVTSIFYGFTHSLKLAHEIGNKNAMFYRSSHRKDFDEYYVNSNYHYINDSVSTIYCGLDTKPFLWHETDMWWNSATCTQKKIYRESEDFNMTTGVSLPVRFGISGVGGIGLATSELNSVSFNRMWDEHETNIKTIAYMFDEFARKEHMNHIYSLADREKETLSWLSCGKSIKEIAYKLGTSPSTVEKQIRSARTKLKARNNEQATVKALILGIIAP